jgi:DNA repair protein RadD
MPKTLAPHQLAAALSPFDWFSQGRRGNPLIVAPVSAGKSLIMAEIIRRIHADAPRTRIVALAHVKELLQQNAAELHEHWPEADYGFYCAGLGQKRLHNDITFASIQSVHSQLAAFNRPPQVIIIDECHLISHNDATTYRRFIDACLVINPKLVVIGLTGTPFRADSGRLDEGADKLFDGVCYEIPMRWMIEQGYWCRPVTPRLATRMSVEGVAVSRGDYVASQLEKAVDVDATTQACVRETLQHAAGRRKWLVFTAGVTHCEHVRDAFRAAGVSAEMVTGETPREERDAVLGRFRRGEITALVNVAVLTTGFNVPDIDCLVFMRPMRSPVLYVQCIGRGVRVTAPVFGIPTAEERLAAIAASAKPDCLVLDFGGVVAELGPVDQIEVRKRASSGSTPQEGTEVVEASLYKRCPSCGELCATQARYCLSCGYAFASEGLEKKAGEKAIISTDAEPETYEVFSMNLSRHIKSTDVENELEGKPLKNPPSLKVTYNTIGGSFHEWICFEHHRYDAGDPKRFAWTKAVQWHNKRLPEFKPPMSVQEALVIGYAGVRPTHVTIRREGKYSRVIDCEWQKSNTPTPADERDEDFLF